MLCLVEGEIERHNILAGPGEPAYDELNVDQVRVFWLERLTNRTIGILLEPLAGLIDVDALCDDLAWRAVVEAGFLGAVVTIIAKHLHAPTDAEIDKAGGRSRR